MSKAKDILMEARRLIQDVGFCKGRMHWIANDDWIKDDKMAYCTFGAILEATSRLGYYPGESNLALNVFYKTLGENVYIHRWNDDPVRTKSEVLSQFLMAIDLCEE